MKNLVSYLCASLLLVSNFALADVAEDRAEYDKSANETIAKFKQEKPDISSKMSAGVGYAVFSNVGVNLFVISAGGGTGIAVDNASGKKTYMKMGEAGVGFGLGVKDFRALMIFKTRESFDKFVESGWLFGAQADAAATAGDKGGSAEVEGAIGDVQIYQLTEAGLSLEATIKGTKFWQDGDLN
ncbi:MULTISPECIES: YSC84-related protein [unclassified Agarivorans]|uniref:lipid-binding SYLF domain-containing protein n=1 Tax=unclassified Agarivorans TaxID=2636026 RepID=UPI0026E37658|nr:MULTISPECIES: YSC84-related protein [unclassified Agarivorans]MDO6685897.1 YSC84-related protein [Agarivorans sp. 3_MG-2023]MDO6713965.1 YSC84-related protein [Agarivorans sp. 2_MG-2023]MDO6762297.1 YSC84-related protein [Agarivorans sp. 1_MG-2023]